MGIFVREPNSLFSDVRYRTKTTAEVREAMLRKVRLLTTLIAEREERVKTICRDNQIEQAYLVDLILQYQKSDRKPFVSYAPQQQGIPSEVVVPAGVVASIVREKEMYESERGQLKRIELILRNIRDEELYHDHKTGEVKTRLCLHSLSDDDLEYLGF